LFGNKRSNSAIDPRSRHGRRRPATHDFVETKTASRGWRAFARHDDENNPPRSRRFGYFPTSPNLTQSHSDRIGSRARSERLSELLQNRT
jgi:hypothetical protein